MIHFDEELNATGYTLILPSVAVGNVGQLGVDLLISTLRLRRVGCILDASFIPIAGADPYDDASEDTCTSVDLYASHEEKLVVVQIRSPLVNEPSKFFEALLKFIVDSKISKVIILTSSYGHEKRDEQLRTTPYRYLATTDLSKTHSTELLALSWLPLEPKPLDDFGVATALHISGGGFAKSLHELLQRESVPCLTLLKYCSEGDNIPDAVELVNRLNEWLKVIPVDGKNNSCLLKYPPSWKFLFGNSPPRDIY